MIPSTTKLVTLGNAHKADADGEKSRARCRQIEEDVRWSIESMRKSSAQILAQSAAVSGVVAAAALDAVKAIWAAILNLLRYLARLFGVKLKEQEKQEFAGSNSDAAGAGAGAGADKAFSDLSSDKAAAEIQNLVTTAADLPAVHADAFMRALEFAGIHGSELALLDMSRQPGFADHAKSMDICLDHCLKNVKGALDRLDMQVVQASIGRANAAQMFAATQEPPILTEDLIKIQRHALEKGLLNSEQVAVTEELLQADDTMKAVAAHRQVIVEMTMLIVGQASASGVDLAPYASVLARIGGADWESKVSAAADSLTGEPVVVTASPDSAKTSVGVSQSAINASMTAVEEVDAAIDSNSEAAIQARNDAQKAVAAFFNVEPDTPLNAPSGALTAVAAARERLLKAALEAAKFHQSFDADSADDSADCDK